MNDQARYFLAQYVPDPLRKESTNVGVFVELRGKVGCRFFAESDNSEISLSTAARRVNHAGIYKQWVAFWRRHASRGVLGLERILKEPKINFQVIDGGVATEIGDDDVYKITNNLFFALVDEDNDGRPGQTKSSPRFETLVKEEFDNLGITGTGKLLVKHPVQFHPTLSGKAAEHTPSFSQMNGKLYVMEAIRVTESMAPRTVSDRAGATAHMLSDLRSARGSRFNGTVILNIKPDLISADNVTRLRRIVSEVADEVVNWQSDDERKRLLNRCYSVAQGSVG